MIKGMNPVSLKSHFIKNQGGELCIAVTLLPHFLLQCVAVAGTEVRSARRVVEIVGEQFPGVFQQIAVARIEHADEDLF